MKTLAPHRKVPKPILIGHTVSRQYDIAEIRIKDKVRVYGPLTVWIADDGCILAVHDNPRFKPPEDGLIGSYNESAKAEDIADDIGIAALEYGNARMRARA